MSIVATAGETRIETLEVPRLYKVQEVAELLQVGHTYVYEEISQGRLKTIDLANGEKREKLRVAADDLQAFLDSRRVR
ncbi:helix-turn-helix domain-containing protein [Zhihengliuella sp.]|uniref:helix-turn-helix domain-containing protein n=1 Tax=Zhihengliuella sp. TaxID=1954483 RepID=UPI002810F74E|nr:helix-turn-helix domain-containing protein [Zhihengliuella sp.]